MNLIRGLITLLARTPNDGGAGGYGGDPWDDDEDGNGSCPMCDGKGWLPMGEFTWPELQRAEAKARAAGLSDEEISEVLDEVPEPDPSEYQMVIQRCDTCQRFSTDEEASLWARRNDAADVVRYENQLRYEYGM